MDSASSGRTLARAMRVRPPAAAGSFYPADPIALRHVVDGMLVEATPVSTPGAGDSLRDDVDRCPKALIVPHAGYVYSGPVAASAYAVLMRSKPPAAFSRVVLLGPSHRVPCGLVVPDADVLETPLGRVDVDLSSIERLSLPRSELAHRAEHSLEVQLPFLLRSLGSFRVVPVVVCDAPESEVVAMLEALWGGPETLVVVSSDLSHYLPYDEAKRVDDGTAQAILSLQSEDVDDERACGALCVRGLLTVARRKKLRPRLLDLRNSRDTAGTSENRVVGYGSFAFCD